MSPQAYTIWVAVFSKQTNKQTNKNATAGMKSGAELM